MAEPGTKCTTQSLQNPCVPEAASHAKAAGTEVGNKPTKGPSYDVGHAKRSCNDAGGLEVKVKMIIVVLMDNVVGCEFDAHAVSIEEDEDPCTVIGDGSP